jgi:hypothetical protein
MYNFKRIAALGLAMTMVLGSSLTAFASEATSQDVTGKVTTAKEVIGTGSEEYIDKNIMKVTMPTDAAIAKFFDYKLDPQGLIAEAKSYAGTAITGTATGIVFLNQASGKATISNTSDTFKITNKSSIPVDLGVEVKLEAAASSAMDVDLVSTTSDFSGSGDSAKAIYLGLKATNDIERALSGTAITPNAVLLSGASQYATTWDATANKYVYAAKDNAKFSDFTFNLTGAINKTLGNDTWASITGDVGGAGRTPTLKNPPKVSLKITLLPVADPLSATLKWASVTTNGTKVDVLTVAKKDAASGKGGFVAADVEALYVNGREITSANYTIDENGFINITLEKIYANYYTDWAAETATTAKKNSVKSLIKNVKTTADDKPTFYGEL